MEGTVVWNLSNSSLESIIPTDKITCSLLQENDNAYKKNTLFWGSTFWDIHYLSKHHFCSIKHMTLIVKRAAVWTWISRILISLRDSHSLTQVKTWSGLMMWLCKSKVWKFNWGVQDIGKKILGWSCALSPWERYMKERRFCTSLLEKAMGRGVCLGWNLD